MPNAPNVARIPQGKVAPVPTQADFPSLPTAGPAVLSQSVAQGPKAPLMSNLSEEAQNKIKRMTTHVIEAQLKEMLPQILAAVAAALNLTPQ